MKENGRYLSRLMVSNDVLKMDGLTKRDEKVSCCGRFAIVRHE